MFGMFATGTFWFWSLLIVEFFFLFYLVGRKKYIAAPISMFGVIALIVCFGSGLDYIQWIVENPWTTLAYVAIYFAIGVLFVAFPFVGKWACFVRRVRDFNREMKKDWLSENERLLSETKSSLLNLPADNPIYEELKEFESALENFRAAAKSGRHQGLMTAELLPFWKKYEERAWIYDSFGDPVSIKKPEPDKFKARIISWISYWPPIMFLTILNDPIRHIGRMIYDAVSGILKSISDSTWKNEDKL